MSYDAGQGEWNVGIGKSHLKRHGLTDLQSERNRQRHTAFTDVVAMAVDTEKRSAAPDFQAQREVDFMTPEAALLVGFEAARDGKWVEIGHDSREC